MSLMDRPDEVRRYLLDKGWLAAEDQTDVVALSGGVSNQVWKISAPEGRWVMKQALPKLKVKADWYSDVARIIREQDAMRVLARFMPVGVIPEIVHDDPERFTYVMTCAPEEAVTWKTQLLQGDFDPSAAEQAGKLLAAMHQGSRSLPPETLQPFLDLTFFKQLRIEPFYSHLYENAYPGLRQPIQRLEQQVLESRTALIHGDYSPKNILVHGNANLIVLDYEVAHWGNPVFDQAFCMAHLMLKGWALEKKSEALACIRAFLAGYGAPAPDLLAHIGVMLLARIDGKSPVDYIPSALTTAIRRTGVEWVAPQGECDALKEILNLWKEEESDE
jgi:aminoglycoside phosphotransferase (APT) family kinase protein